MTELRVLPLAGVPEAQAGDDVAELVMRVVELEDDDVVVLSQKLVSKAEGRVVRLDEVEPSARARDSPARIDMAILRYCGLGVELDIERREAPWRNGFYSIKTRFSPIVRDDTQ